MSITRLDLYRNPSFNIGAGLIKQLLWYLCNALIFNSWLPFYGLKITLLRLFGAKVGKGVVIKPYVRIKFAWKLSLGDHVWIGEGVWIDNLDFVDIRNHVCVSQGALLLCGNHDFTQSTFDLKTGKITLEDGVWIGAKSIVCPNVICKNHSVLGVMSVATKNLEAYHIYKGNPAESLKERLIQ